MRLVRHIFLILSPVIFLSFITGCASSRYSHYQEAPEGQFFLTPSPEFSTSFPTRWGAEMSELNKVQYLLDRLAQSNVRFIRNGERYDGKVARQWFLYKMTHWVRRVKTAQEFITRVTGFSQKTGKPYLVEFPDGQIYSLKSILYNELTALQGHLSKLKLLSRATAPQPGQVQVTHPAPRPTA